MAVYLVKGARDSVIGNISDAGPFEIYLNAEEETARAGNAANDLLVHNLYDATDSKLEDISVDGILFTDVVSKESLNAGLGLTTTATGPQFIFRSVSNCTNGFTYIPPTPTPTPTVTPSVTPSVTPTTSVTPSITPSVTATVTPTISNTPSISVTPSITPTVSVSISTTPSTSVTPSVTPTISNTPSISITPSISNTPGVSSTPASTPPSTPPAVGSSNGQVTFSGVSRSSSGTITGTINVSMTSYNINSHVHVDIYAYGNSGYATDNSAYYVGNASSVSSNPTATFSVSDSDWADYANGGGTVTVRAILYLNSDQQDIEYTYVTVPSAPSPTRTPSNTPPASVTPSNTPPVPSPTRTPSTTPPNSPLNRNSDYIYGAGSTSCSAACSSGTSTRVYYTDNFLSGGTILYSSATGYGLATSGYFEYEGWCYYNSAAVYELNECDEYSVIEGTMIATSTSSSIAVEDLEIGDEVLSKHVTGLPDSGDGREAIKSWSADNIDGNHSTALVVTNASIDTTGIYNFNNGVLLTTRKHMHMVKRDGLWKILYSFEVTPGDIFEDINGDEIQITSVEIEDRAVKVYSLNVETDDMYYANGILTHNDR